MASQILGDVTMEMRQFMSASRISLFLYRTIITVCLYATWIGADLPLQDIKGPEEYCTMQHEKFSPKCSPNEVIVLTHAQFGRMKVGRCVKNDYGHVGCSADVLGVLEPLCSGRPSCSVDSNNPDFSRRCPVDLASYLEASYACLPVTTTGGRCRSSPTRLTSRSGFLSSHIATETGEGSSRCPWVIPLSQGQVVNITLHNFLSPFTPAAKLHPHACFNVLDVKQGRNVHSARLCMHDAREKHVLITYDSDIEITFRDQSSNIGHFVVSYQVSGCENPAVPEYGYLQRQGDEAVISCNFTETAWSLSCDQDENWTPLKSMTCPPKPKKWSFLDIFEDLKTINPYVLLGVVAGGVALGVLVGGFCLFLAIRAFKRRHPLPPSAKKLRKLQEMEYRQMYALQRMNSAKDGRATPDGLATPSSTTGRRYHTCGRHPVPVQPRPHAPVPQRPEHIYEIPNYEIEENTDTVSRA